MSGIAGLIAFDSDQADRRVLARMSEFMRHRGPDGLGAVQHGPAALAQAHLSMHHLNGRQVLPYDSADLLVVADARLYNRRALAAKLEFSENDADRIENGEWLANAYRRWGEALVDHLDGDFAFAIWDKRAKRLFAARDPFGVKPLFYHATAERLLLASEPKQILVVPGVPIEPNDLVIGEYLFQRFEDLSQTYFRSVLRLVPGHCLVAEGGKVSIRRWWNPDLRENPQFGDERDYYDHFRDLLADAVRKRIDTDYAVGCHLSGGLDSGSLVLLADQLYRQSPRGLPRFDTISAEYLQPVCNESLQIRAVAAITCFGHHAFTADDRSQVADIDEMLWQADRPFADPGQGTFLETADVLDKIGARSLMMGFGGDELLSDGWYVHDLVERGQWRRAWKEIREIDRQGASHWPLSRILLDAVGSALPGWARRVGRLLLFNKQYRPPDFVDAAFYRAYCQQPVSPVWAVRTEHASKTQYMVHRDLIHPDNGPMAELYDAKAAYRGYEVSLPFFDRPLAEYVLSIPFEARVAGPKWKTLVRRGLADLLPSPVSARRLKVDLNDYVATCILKERRELTDRLGDGPWMSGRYLDRERLLSFARSMPPDAPAAAYEHARDLWQAACLELWLRGMLRLKKLQSSPL